MKAELRCHIAALASSFELRAANRLDQLRVRSAKLEPRGLSPLPSDSLLRKSALNPDDGTNHESAAQRRYRKARRVSGGKVKAKRASRLSADGTCFATAFSDLCPLTSDRGSALLEFAVSLPLLVVFLVGIYDFSGAFSQKQKIEHAAQEGAIVAGAQPTSDIQPTNPNPDSLQPVVAAIFNSLAGSKVLPLAKQGDCNAPVDGKLLSGVKWSYTITGCPDTLTITIDRGWVPGNATAGALTSVGTSVTVSYPYRWRFNSVIQLLVPGARYAASTDLSETATVHNQT